MNLLSDDDNKIDDDYFEDVDMFSRLEEIRAKLEEQLGFVTFCQAYKTVQVCKTSVMFLSPNLKAFQRAQPNAGYIGCSQSPKNLCFQYRSKKIHKNYIEKLFQSPALSFTEKNRS